MARFETKYNTTLNRAILDLKNQRDKVHQYQRRIETIRDRETQAAKDMLRAGDKPRALLALRRKKYQETLLARAHGQMSKLEELVASVEFELVQKEVFNGLQQGTRVLQQIHREMGGIENVERLMGESAEAIAYQNVRNPQLLARIGNAVVAQLLTQSFCRCLGDKRDVERSHIS
jgi:charged multivesicular body protein 6